MKKVILVAALLFSGFLTKIATAQVHLNVNIGVQPVWGPVGYDHAEYYYMPDIDAYYNVPKHQYIYQEGGRWRFATTLPGQFRGYNINNGYKVVINDDPQPYRHPETYRTKYSGYKGRQDQEVIRNSHDPKYFVIKDHPEHNQWKKNQNQGKGNRRRNN
jgi:hypothetical protein